MKGFTLLECLCCVALVAILLSFSLPSYQSWLAHSKIQQVSVELRHAISQARNRAIIEKKTTLLMPIESKNWSSGVQVRRASTKEGHEGSIIYIWPWHFPTLQVKWSGFENPNQIRFSPALSHSSCNGRFLIRVGALSQTITINKLGRVIT